MIIKYKISDSAQQIITTHNLDILTTMYLDIPSGLGESIKIGGIRHWNGRYEVSKDGYIMGHFYYYVHECKSMYSVELSWNGATDDSQ